MNLIFALLLMGMGSVLVLRAKRLQPRRVLVRIKLTWEELHEMLVARPIRNLNDA